jgi:hypothetical protein
VGQDQPFGAAGRTGHYLNIVRRKPGVFYFSVCVFPGLEGYVFKGFQLLASGPNLSFFFHFQSSAFKL